MLELARTPALGWGRGSGWCRFSRCGHCPSWPSPWQCPPRSCAKRSASSHRDRTCWWSAASPPADLGRRGRQPSRAGAGTVRRRRRPGAGPARRRPAAPRAALGGRGQDVEVLSQFLVELACWMPSSPTTGSAPPSAPRADEHSPCEPTTSTRRYRSSGAWLSPAPGPSWRSPPRSTWPCAAPATWPRTADRRLGLSTARVGWPAC